MKILVEFMKEIHKQVMIFFAQQHWFTMSM